MYVKEDEKKKEEDEDGSPKMSCQKPLGQSPMENMSAFTSSTHCIFASQIISILSHTSHHVCYFKYKVANEYICMTTVFLFNWFRVHVSEVPLLLFSHFPTGLINML